MPNPKKPEIEIVELVDHLPIGYVILAFLAGAMIVAAAVAYMARFADEESENTDAG